MPPVFTDMNYRHASLCLLLLTSCGRDGEDVTKAVEKALKAKRESGQDASPESGQANAWGTVTPAKPKAVVPQDGQKLVLLCAADAGEPFSKFQAQALRIALRGLDGIVTDTLDAQGDADLQKQQLQEALTRKPAYLILSCVDPTLAADVMPHFITAGTQVISTDERLTGDGIVAAPHIAQKELGATAAKVVIEALKRKTGAEPAGRVVHLMGRESGFVSEARAQGLHDQLKAHPGILVVHEAPTDWTEEAAKICVEEALRLQGQFDVIVAQSDLLALGASQAIDTAQLRDKVMIIGMDAGGGDGGGIELIAKSVIDASVHQARPVEAAFRLIQAAEKSGTKIPSSAPKALPIEAITPSNVDEAFRRVKSGDL
jgi:inositol transport system substrate-binding protein